MASDGFAIYQATNPNEFNAAKDLFLEYQKTLGFDLEFQNFAKELDQMDVQYSSPNGALFLVDHNKNGSVACAGLRRIDNKVAELKRMYVKEAFRGNQLGKRLLDACLDKARTLGYEKVRLDSIPTMKRAISLYRKVGFYEIPAYRFNPIEGTIYMQMYLELGN